MVPPYFLLLRLLMPYNGKFSLLRKRRRTLKLIWLSVQEVYNWWVNQSYFFKTVVITCCSCMWIVSCVIVYPPKRFSISKIQLITEANSSTKDAVENFLLPYRGKGIFEMNARALQANLLKRFTWVQSVAIRRTVLGVLIIQLLPRRAIARFQIIEHPRELVLIDCTGFIFKPSQDWQHFDHLPCFKGLVSQTKYMLQFYKELNTILQAQNLKIMQLQLDQEMRFNVQLNNGIRLLLGHIEPLHQLKHLLSLNAQVLHRANQIAYIDLRYSTGIAVKLHESIK